MRFFCFFFFFFFGGEVLLGKKRVYGCLVCVFTGVSWWVLRCWIAEKNPPE